MRASVNLDADVYSFAASYASEKGIPLGIAINQLLRRVEAEPAGVSATLITSRLGLLVRARGGQAVTMERAKELSEDDFG